MASGLLWQSLASRTAVSKRQAVLPTPQLVAVRRRCWTAVLLRSASMSPKRNDRVGDDGSDDDDVTTSTPTKVFHAKPCLCCGREITPRSKWARNWDAIRFCSDQCRSWRAIVPVTMAGKGDDDKTTNTTPSILQKFLEWHTPLFPSDDRIAGRLHLDAWIEASILHTARHSQQPSLRTLSDVSHAMHQDLKGCHAQDFATAIAAFLCDHKPGEREMLRRAARRLVVLPYERLALAATAAGGGGANKHNIDYADAHRRLVLTQRNGKTQIRTLADVSHAKGDLEICLSRG